MGKSTLANALLGEERLIVFDQPGTTRDSIYVDFEWRGRPYTLIDTAGVRKRGRVAEAAEKFSVMKTMQAITDANVTILVLDAAQEISEQDAHIGGFILEAGRALVLAVNKWEAVPASERDLLKRRLERKLDFLSFARVHFISAREGRGVGAVMKSVGDAYAAAMAKLPDPEAHARAAGGGDTAAASARGLRPAEVALCAPGRLQSAPHHRSRDRARARARNLSALSGTFHAKCFPTRGHASQGGIQERTQSLRVASNETRKHG